MAVKTKGVFGYWGVINLSESLKSRSDLKTYALEGSMSRVTKLGWRLSRALVAIYNQSLFKALMARSRAVL